MRRRLRAAALIRGFHYLGESCFNFDPSCRNDRASCDLGGASEWIHWSGERDRHGPSQRNYLVASVTLHRVSRDGPAHHLFRTSRCRNLHFAISGSKRSAISQHKRNLDSTPLSRPFLISASYYPWYNASAWQYTECHNGALREELIPAELPILGTYDSQDQQVVTQQIAWSVAGGVNVWDLEWVKPNDLLDTTIQSTILTNPHIGDIKFVIFYDYAIRFNNDFNLTSDKIATIVSDFQYIAAISSITRAT